jgi:integrase
MPHTFRHTAATWLTEGDVEIEKAARFLGHRDLATTQRCSKPKGGQLTGAAQVVELRLKRGRSVG